MNQPGFWWWLFRGSGGGPGLTRFADRWALVHCAIGVLLTWAVRVDLATSAATVLLPLAGVLIGLSFAWAGNAQALLQTEEIEELASYRQGGFSEYVFTYQLAILTILITLVAWGLAGLRVFDDSWPRAAHHLEYTAVKWTVFTLSSFSLRECWHVVLGAQWMLLIRRELRSRSNKREGHAEQPPPDKRVLTRGPGQSRRSQ